MSKPNVPEHERLFDEICGKLNELSGSRTESAADRFERLQGQLKKSQDEWKSAQNMMQERMQNFEQFSNSQNDLGQEIKRLSDLLDQERLNNSRTGSDLAKALELNLKLQFDIEEVRTKASQLVAEERKHNQFLVEKNRGLSTELELGQAMNQEIRMELGKAREKFLGEQNNWTEHRGSLELQLKTQGEEFEMTNLKMDEAEEMIRRQNTELQNRGDEITRQSGEINSLFDTLKAFEEHAQLQSETMRQITGTAERKLIELKLALDKKIVESNDYYSHLQQALAQVQILRQENSALKEYIQKIAHLHQTGHAPPPPQPQQQTAPLPTSVPAPAPVPAMSVNPTPAAAVSAAPSATPPPRPAFPGQPAMNPAPAYAAAPAYASVAPTPPPTADPMVAQAPPKPRPPFPGKAASGQ